MTEIEKENMQFSAILPIVNDIEKYCISLQQLI